MNGLKRLVLESTFRAFESNIGNGLFSQPKMTSPHIAYKSKRCGAMAELSITCAKCGAKIPLSKALMTPIEEKLRKEIEGDNARKEQEIADKEEALRVREEKIEKSVEQKVKERTILLEGKVKAQMDEQYSTELKDLHQALEEKKEKLRVAEGQELAVRKKMRELEDREKALALELERKLAEERGKMEEGIRKHLQEENQLKEREHQDKIESLTRQVEGLQQKLQQGSQQTQGETLENVVEDSLRQCFPLDSIDPVPKGVKGPDLVHRVCRPSGETCGIIAWEMKRTKDWNDGWVEKLRNDLPAINAQLGIIVTAALPEDIKNFGFRKGVVVTNFDCFVPVATMLRSHILELHRQRQAGINSEEKKDALYDYLLSPQFRQRVESVAEPLIQMKTELEKEARAIERSWSKRSKQIDKAVIGIARMYGDMQGIVGRNLPDVKVLSLPERSESHPEGQTTYQDNDEANGKDP